VNDATVRPSLRTPITASLLLHGAIVALFLVLRPPPAPPAPPLYRVQMVAAPPGARTQGIVRQQPAPVQQPVTQTPPRPRTATSVTPAPPVTSRTETKVAPIPAPTRTPTRVPEAATPTPTPAETKQPTQPAPTAGGGATGGKGTDVANVNTGGIEFPFPAYLENIVRQIALQFRPSSKGALRAEVAFMIRRDGSVAPNSIRLTVRSGNFAFDTDARAAVEAAANARAFGPLPSGFADDVLPVIFRFDPSVIR
jgi:periplasmic protein TonB